MAQETLAGRSANDRGTTGREPSAARQDAPRRSADSLADTLAETRDEVVGEAKSLGRQAADEARAQADAAKDDAAGGLRAFSEALQAARSELADRKLGFAGDMLSQAADGLEGFARALEGRSSGEMLEAVRDFGRRNPAGFMAGAVLAGFALGRVAAASDAAPAAGQASQGDAS